MPIILLLFPNTFSLIFNFLCCIFVLVFLTCFMYVLVYVQLLAVKDLYIILLLDIHYALLHPPPRYTHIVITNQMMVLLLLLINIASNM